MCIYRHGVHEVRENGLIVRTPHGDERKEDAVVMMEI
jgi:hypothetical protein